ncbi:MAG: hypothetical protein AAB870_00245 [Patescibacteria group bacterium]
MNKEQIWFCDGCKKRGTITYDTREDVMGVTERIGTNHRTFSPQCENGTRELRVVNEEVISQTELDKITVLSMI